jgi:hypothetical protein
MSVVACNEENCRPTIKSDFGNMAFGNNISSPSSTSLSISRWLSLFISPFVYVCLSLFLVSPVLVLGKAN